MPAPIIGAALAPIAGAAAGKLFGSSQPKAQAVVPQDMTGLRGQQTQLLQWLTGFGGPPPGMGNPTAINRATPEPGGGFPGGPNIGPGMGGPNIGPMPGQDLDLGAMIQGLSPQFTGMGGPASGFQATRRGMQQNPLSQFQQPQNAGGVVGDRLQQYFGSLGSGTNSLQNTAANAAQRLLTQQNPNVRAMEAGGGILPSPVEDYYTNLLQGGGPNLGPGQDVETALSGLGQTGGIDPTLISQVMDIARGGGMDLGGGGQGGFGSGAVNDFLTNLLKTNPGQSTMGLLEPTFQRNLERANQQGGRFGSANAILRSNAVTDQQAQLAQMLQQGVNQQLQGAGLLGQLANQAGAGAQGARANELDARLRALGLGSNLLQAQAGNRLSALGQLGGFRQQGGLAGFQGQLQGAGQFGNLGLGAANQQLQNILGAGQLGNTLAGQADLETQRRLQLAAGLLGQAQGAAFNVPTQVTPSGAQQGAAFGQGIGNTLIAALPYLTGKKG